MAESTGNNSPSRDAVSILAIDNDIDYLKSFIAHFKPKGHRVFTITNPRLVLSAVKKANPDIIVLDTLVGDIKGVNVVNALRKRRIAVPVILAGKDITGEITGAARKLSVGAILKKQPTFDTLEAKIISLVTMARMGGQAGAHAAESTRPAQKKKESIVSVLLVTENKEYLAHPELLIPVKNIGTYHLRYITKSSLHEAIGVLKNPTTPVRMILVDASNETRTKNLVKLLKIVVSKTGTPVFFYSDSFSTTFQDDLMKVGFTNLITKPEEFTTQFTNALSDSKDGALAESSRKRHEVFQHLKSIKSIPPLPDIYHKIEKLARNPKASPDDYSRVLELDPGITARLLRMSNSAYYAFNRKIVSVRDAVALMGTREILSLVRLACVTGSLKVAPEIENEAKKIWEHCASCAITATLLLEREEFKPEEDIKDEVFIAGIIHDIGKIILWKFFTESYMSFLLNEETSPHPIIGEEEKAMGVNHSEVGRSLAEHWELPEPLVNVIAHHHTPTLKDNSDMVTIIHLANVISNLVWEIIPENQDPGLSEQVLQNIGKTGDDIRALAEELKPAITKKVDVVSFLISS